MNKWVIIDFDSTINKLEALDELAKIVDSRTGTTEVSDQIKAITELGMKGEISFPDSLKQRMELLRFNREELQVLVQVLRENFTDSFLTSIHQLEEMSDHVLIISGGFKDFIVPALKDFKIKPENIYANEFKYDKEGNCIGFAENNFLALENGKVNLVKSLKLNGDIVVVGDGYTDYQIKELGEATSFIAFVENVNRPNVVAKADFVAKNFADVLQYLNN